MNAHQWWWLLCRALWFIMHALYQSQPAIVPRELMADLLAEINAPIIPESIRKSENKEPDGK